MVSRKFIYSSGSLVQEEREYLICSGAKEIESCITQNLEWSSITVTKWRCRPCFSTQNGPFTSICQRSLGTGHSNLLYRLFLFFVVLHMCRPSSLMTLVTVVLERVFPSSFITWTIFSTLNPYSFFH